MNFLLSLVAVFASFYVQAEEPLKAGFTQQELEFMAEANSQQSAFEAEWQEAFGHSPGFTAGVLLDTEPVPVAEYHEAGYLIFSSTYNFGSKKAKQKMAENLPDGVTLVVYTYDNSKGHLQRVRQQFSGLVDDDRLEVIYLPGAMRGFWARDGIPVPVWRNDKAGDQSFGVVDARYYHNFEADKEVSQIFNAELSAHRYYYEGGNFMANALGDCLVVNKVDTAKIPDSIFTNHYGCKKLIRLPHRKGIGHADESVKFMGDNIVLTDLDEYREVLEQEGFEVRMLPRPNNEVETYVNSLIINGTVFVPVFSQDTDKDALQVYEDLGLKVVPINSTRLSNGGQGSIHCITMTYPPVEFKYMVKALGGQL